MNVDWQFARVLFGYAMARAHNQRARGRNQVGASALEWAIISAIVVAAALLIAAAINRVVTRRIPEIERTT